MEPVTTAFAALASSFNYLRPAKSPFVFITVVFVFVFTLKTAAKAPVPLLWPHFALPMYVVVLIVAILAFFYVPSEVRDLEKAKSDKEKSLLISEIEDQLKFARSFCLATGVVSLYFVCIHTKQLEWLFYLIYLVCLFHILVFLLYMIIRNSREEPPTKHSIFQVAFLTSAFLFCAVMNYQGIDLEDLSYLYNDNGEEQPVLVFDWSFINSLFFIGLWFAYSIFWIGRLRQILRVIVVN